MDVDDSSSTSSDDDGGDEEGFARRITTTVQVCAVSAVAVLIATDPSFLTIPTAVPRCPNVRRNRDYSLAHVRDWDDNYFKKQFRLWRSDFNIILSKISPFLERNPTKARNSSGSSVTPELRLLVTLRILAGASYLDMEWYGICTDHVMSIVLEVVRYIILCFRDNTIHFPGTATELERNRTGWKRRLFRKFGIVGQELFEGLLGAGDGLLVHINQPKERDLDGKPASIYHNRKNCFALVVLGFCDAFCRFITFEVNWPGSTNDCTAFGMSMLWAAYNNGLLPDWACFVADEAFSSYGAPVMTPFSHSQLQRAMAEGGDGQVLYRQMLAYNHVLSSLRIHIERAFGQLVRRWGILWRNLETSLQDSVNIILCCAILHNICVTSWMRDHDGGTDGYSESIPEHDCVPHMCELPDDAQVMERMENTQPLPEGVRAHNSDMRENLMHAIYNAGISINDADIRVL